MSFRSFSEAGGITWHDDMLIEILLRLPAKCLVRYKLVCRNWLSLIDAPHFSRLHTLRHPRPEPSLILHTRTSPFFYFHPVRCSEKLVPYHFNFTDPKILSSCNWLLVLHSARDYYVYNPTTKQSRKVVLTVNDEYTVVMGLNLAFDPSKSLHYKIVCVGASKGSSSGRVPCYRIEVYDSESRTWKLGSEPFTAPRKKKFSHGVYWNNAIHWGYNMYYDIDENGVRKLPNAKIPWPEGGGGAASHCQVQESNGKLYHFIIVSDLGDKSVALFELQADRSQWLLKYHEPFGRAPGKFRILNFIEGDGEETGALIFHVPGKITAYRFSDKSCAELIDLKNALFYKEDAVQFEPQYVHQFGESFAPV